MKLSFSSALNYTSANEFIQSIDPEYCVAFFGRIPSSFKTYDYATVAVNAHKGWKMDTLQDVKKGLPLYLVTDNPTANGIQALVSRFKATVMSYPEFQSFLDKLPKQKVLTVKPSTPMPENKSAWYAVRYQYRSDGDYKNYTDLLVGSFPKAGMIDAEKKAHVNSMINKFKTEHSNDMDQRDPREAKWWVDKYSFVILNELGEFNMFHNMEANFPKMDDADFRYCMSKVPSYKNILSDYQDSYFRVRFSDRKKSTKPQVKYWVRNSDKTVGGGAYSLDEAKAMKQNILSAGDNYNESTGKYDDIYIMDAVTGKVVG